MHVIELTKCMVFFKKKIKANIRATVTFDTPQKTVNRKRLDVIEGNLLAVSTLFSQ